MTSQFYGGPERLALGLTQSLPVASRSKFVLFPDKGKSLDFQRVLQNAGLEVRVLTSDTPHALSMVRQIRRILEEAGADILCCHGYKADLLGLLAARKAGIPVIALSHGWTAETWKVRAYEALDRVCLRRMDRVICVSEGQAEKVRIAGVLPSRVDVIRNAVQVDRFDHVDPEGRGRLEASFTDPPKRIVGSVGRLSPEKGFGVLVEAAAIVIESNPEVGFIHFGDGPLRSSLAGRISELGLQARFVLEGFRNDVDRFIPHFDLSVLPSFTEGLPTVVLESFAAGVPVVATAVGGTPEAVVDGVDGFLVPPGDPEALARRILDVLRLGDEGKVMGRRGRERIRSEFTFPAQALRFQQLCDALVRPHERGLQTSSATKLQAKSPQ